MSEKLYEYTDFYTAGFQQKNAVISAMQQDLHDFLADFKAEEKKIFNRKPIENVRRVFRWFISEQEQNRNMEIITPEVRKWGSTMMSQRTFEGRKLGMALFNLVKTRYKGSRNLFFEDMGYKKDEGSVRFAIAPERMTATWMANTIQPLSWYPAVQKFYFKKFLQRLEETKKGESPIKRTPKDLENWPEYGQRLLQGMYRIYKGNRDAFFTTVGYNSKEGPTQFKKLRGNYDRTDPVTQKRAWYKFLTYLKENNISHPTPGTIINWKEDEEPIGNMFFSGVIQRVYHANYKKFFDAMHTAQKEIGFTTVSKLTAENFKNKTKDLIAFLKTQDEWGPATIKDWDEAYYQYLIEHYRTSVEGEETDAIDWDTIVHDVFKKPRLAESFSHIFEEKYKKAS